MERDRSIAGIAFDDHVRYIAWFDSYFRSNYILSEYVCFRMVRRRKT